MCHHHHHDESHQRAHDSADLGQAGADEVARCPVMTSNLLVKADAEAAGLVREHQGQRYYLCCAGCGPLFDADPTQYVTVA